MSIKVEEKVILSESLIWQMQKDYFDKKGVDAWNKQVPFYVTSNPVVAHSYAQMCAALMKDYKDKHNDDCFYILELGTGSGQFSCYFLTFLTKMLERCDLKDLKFCYVMTDFTLQNLKFWQTQPKLKEFVDKGVLDFAIYNLEEQNDIELVNKKITLNKDTAKAPITVVANYIFDTVIHDAFNISNNYLNLSKISLSTTNDNFDVATSMPKKLEDLTTDFTNERLYKENGYYKSNTNITNLTRSDEHKKLLDQVIFGYKDLISDGSFLLPVGALDCIDHLASISSVGIMILSTDKGYSHLFEIEGRHDPRVAFHSSFSLSVNFDAIGRYIDLLKGDSLFPEPRDGIKTAVFLLGLDKINKLPEIKNTFDNNLGRFTPADFFHYHRMLREGDSKLRTLPRLLSHFNLCNWDPYTFSLYHQEILDEITNSNRLIQEGFLAGMRKMCDLVYVLPGAKDHYFNMGLLCHYLEDYNYAIKLYELSNSSSLQKDIGYAHAYNLGLCYYALENFVKAQSYFKVAIGFPDEENNQVNKTAAKWLEDIESKIAK
jgi:tetratricopeptide (TPR) repeat protein